MRKYILLGLTVFFVQFISCTGPANPDYNATENARLIMTFSNVSNLDFNAVTVSGKDLGTLKIDQSKSLDFDSFGFDTGMPDEDISIKINDTELNNFNRNFWCGTEKIRADSGTYIIKINVVDSFLVICCDNPPSFEYPVLP
ncbi:MAG: hypothetical protein H6627_09190 [Calditrichae bacterium]|nr:hypothetical protein [Calditrichia bacterium]